MKIVVLLGSPNRSGSSNLLAESFRRGAEEAGHSVDLIDVAHSSIHPCTGCIHCGYEGPCVQNDDMETIREKILGADMMVFVTPLYYETAKNLAALFGVAARIIRNDITALSCTYPIQTIRGKYGGIQVASCYHPYRQELSPQQEVLLRKLMVNLEGEDLTVMESILTKFARRTG